jgi:pyridoxal/pyridoxine/pyridoxamine kinase
LSSGAPGTGVACSEGFGGTGGIFSAYFIAQLREARADLSNRNQMKRRVRDAPREQRLALPQGDRTDLDDELV